MNIEDYKVNQVKGLKYSRSLKRKATKHEKILSCALKNHDIWFKFQAFFYNNEKLYIPDFRLATQRYKLIIEVDGKNHTKQKEYDAYRTQWLNSNRNCRVLRFTNEQIESNIDFVMAQILAFHPITNTKALRDSFPPDTLQKSDNLDGEFLSITK